jgi:hypothetical protein
MLTSSAFSSDLARQENSNAIPPLSTKRHRTLAQHS